MRRFTSVALLVVVVFVSACSGGNVTLPRTQSTTAPSARPTATPTSSTAPTATPKATASATPTAIASGALSAAAVNSTLTSTVSYYATLPHTDPQSDIQAVAKQMVASGAYTSATVEPGGISGILPDGSPAFVFADVPEDLMPATSANARRASVRAPSTERGRFLGSAPNQHEYAFLYNDVDGAFNPKFDTLWAGAFQNGPLTGPSPQGANTQYGVTTASISLDNIVALGGAGHPIDFLNLTTHGMVGSKSAAADAPLHYFMLSTTTLTTAVKTTYAADFAAGNLAYGIFLSTRETQEANTHMGYLVFTPEFLTSHLHFNPGAVINFGSCYAQSPDISEAVATTLQAAGVGRYYGWTKAVGVADEYQSNSFLFDRLIGEQYASSDTSLAAYAAQRNPPQRPFPLDDIYNVMTTEVRSNVVQPSNGTTYDISDIGYAPNKLAPPLAAGTQAQYLFTDFGKEGLSTNPDFFAFPSISNLQVVESPTAGALTISGKFPVNQGTVQIVDISGKPTLLAVTKWATDAITATLPAGGAGSSGIVTVLDATGIPSNGVPLTQWTGTLDYNEHDSIPDLGGTSGSGSGDLSAQLKIDFREDVHPVVPAIDTTPMPQMFGFAYTEGDSTAQLTNYSGSYQSSGDSPHTATWSLESPAPILSADTPPLGDNTFEVRAFAPQPAPCNVADSGGNTDVFCPLVGIVADPSQILCSDDDSGNLCNDNGDAGLIAYSGPFDALGLLTLTLDPSNYSVAVASETSSFTSAQFYDTDRPATASMSGTIDSPLFPPNTTTPAARKPGPLRIFVRRPRLSLIAPDEAAAAAARPRHGRKHP